MTLVQSATDPALLAAMDASSAEEMACLARSLPGAEIHGDAEVQWFFTGPERFNGVLRFSLANEDAPYVEARIAQVLDYFRAREVGIGWPVGPTTRPAALPAYLETHGLVRESDHIGMVADLFTLNEEQPPVVGLAIKEVLDQETLQAWRPVTLRGFETTAEHAQMYYEGYRTLGFGGELPWHHYLGYLDGEPVASGSLLLHAGVAGIYGITTVPEARRRGIGTAITLHALREARALGYRVGILFPSDMGLNVYRRIGFQECCRIPFYTWSPGH
ncbi:MAG: GNAT family N-acetyltransferase [Chloroflexota bacterium]|nr:GNAT family N-acetyltransferase [Chloroflexota bacterium]